MKKVEIILLRRNTDKTILVPSHPELSSVIQQNIVAPKTMFNRLIFEQNYTFTGG